MRSRSTRRSFLKILPLATVMPLTLIGCTDDSKTSGTQLKISEEAKGQINDMRDMYKAEKAPKKK